MRFHLHLLPLACFAGLMATAAFEDFRRLVIPNQVIVALCLLWPLNLVAAPAVTLAAGLGAVCCAAAVFLAGAVLFSRGLMGGGDVKLLSAATLWAGPGMTASLLAVTAIFGGLLTLLLLSPAGAFLTAGRWPIFCPGAATRANPMPVPYGIAIAAAAAIVTIPPNFS